MYKKKNDVNKIQSDENEIIKKELIQTKREYENLKQQKRKKTIDNYYDLEGTFHIYTLSCPCPVCIDNYVELTKHFPLLNFELYCSLSPEKDSRYKNLIEQTAERYSASQLFFDSIFSKNCKDDDSKNKCFSNNYFNFLKTGQKRIKIHQIVTHQEVKGLFNSFSGAFPFSKLYSKLKE